MTMLYLKRYSWILKPYSDKKIVFWLEKCLFLWVSPLLLINMECASHFCREPANENKQLKKKSLISFTYLIREKAFKGTIVNQTSPSLNEGSLEITLTVPLIFCLVLILQDQGQMVEDNPRSVIFTCSASIFSTSSSRTSRRSSATSGSSSISWINPFL